MNKYEYNCFEINEYTVGGILEKLNELGQDGWHVYKQTSNEGTQLLWAARKLSNPDNNNNQHTAQGFVCCGVLERMNLGWMESPDGTKCMPYIEGHLDDLKYRVNNCPSCGKYVRNIKI